jgi:hypothetical protein
MLPLIALAVLGSASITGLVGGGQAVVVRFAAGEWNRRYWGYKPGEGPLSPRRKGEEHGVRIDITSADLGGFLGGLAAHLEEMRGFQGKTFVLTASESEALRVVVLPVRAILNRKAKVKSQLTQLSAVHDELLQLEPTTEVLAELEEIAAGVGVLLEESKRLDTELHNSVAPVVYNLKNHPRTRVR